MTWTPPQFSDLLTDRLAPWLTSATDPFGDHAKFLTAVAAAAQPFYSLIADAGDDPDDPSWVPGWGALFDVDNCPFQYLPFLGQLVGVPPAALIGADDATARSIIRNEAGQKRGTPAAITSAAQRFLTGTQSVDLLERVKSDGTTPDAYSFVLIVRASEVIDATQLVAAVNAVKPAGLVWTLIQSTEWTLAEFETAEATVTAAETAFPSVTNLEEDL